jgi:hypothetical protein
MQDCFYSLVVEELSMFKHDCVVDRIIVKFLTTGPGDNSLAKLLLIFSGHPAWSPAPLRGKLAGVSFHPFCMG